MKAKYKTTEGRHLLLIWDKDEPKLSEYRNEFKVLNKELFEIDMNDWLNSAREIEIKPEFVDEIRKIAERVFSNTNSRGSLQYDENFSFACAEQGIDLPPEICERVEIIENGGLSGQMEYAILRPLPEQKETESNEVTLWNEVILEYSKCNKLFNKANWSDITDRLQSKFTITRKTNK